MARQFFLKKGANRTQRDKQAHQSRQGTKFFNLVTVSFPHWLGSDLTAFHNCSVFKQGTKEMEEKVERVGSAALSHEILVSGMTGIT